MTLEQQAFEKIKESIITGKYPSETHLTESRLEVDLQMSRTPIRRALLKLEAAGLVSHSSHQGVIVQNIKLSVLDIIHFLELRLFLGRGCFEKASRKLIEFPIDDLKDCLEKMTISSLNSNHQDYFQYLNAFHNTILETIQNELILTTMLEIQHKLMFNSSNYFELRRHNIPSILPKYAELISLLKNKQFEKASAQYTIIMTETIQDLL